MSNNSGHNWFHLGDRHSKWRKYYFDLSLVGHQEWRVSERSSKSASVNTRGLYSSIFKQNFSQWIKSTVFITFN